MPNRIIKESICTSDSLAELSWFEQCLFFRLIVLADDFGIYEARPAIIKGRAFPLNSVTDKQITDALSQLATAGIVDLYTVGGKPYLQLKSWAKHQQIRASKSKYPQMSEADSTCYQLISNDSKCSRNPIQSNRNPKRNPNESKRFTPPSLEEVRDYCNQRKNDVDPVKFYDYFDANNWVDSKGVKVRSWKQKVISWEGRNARKDDNASAVKENTGGKWNISYAVSGDEG